MKKILLAFDGSNFSEGAFEFARMTEEKKKFILSIKFSTDHFLIDGGADVIWLLTKGIL